MKIQLICASFFFMVTTVTHGMSLGFEVKYDGENLLVNGHDMKDETVPRILAEEFVPIFVGIFIKGVVEGVVDTINPNLPQKNKKLINEIAYQMGNVAGSIGVDAYYKDMTRQRNYKKLGAFLGAAVGSTFENSTTVTKFIRDPIVFGSKMGSAAASLILNDMYAAKLYTASGIGQQAGCYMGFHIGLRRVLRNPNTNPLRLGGYFGRLGESIAAACVVSDKTTRGFYLMKTAVDIVSTNDALSRIVLSQYYNYHRLL